MIYMTDLSSTTSSDFVIHVLFNALNLAKDLGSEYFPMELGCIPVTHGEVMDLSS